MAIGSLSEDNIQKYQNKANELQQQINSRYIEVPVNYDETKEYKVNEQQYYIDDSDNKYVVDNKNVKIKANKKEREVAKILSQLYGQPVNLVPVVLNPPGIKTPDYIINKKKFDLKEPTGSSKTTIYDLFKHKKKQSDNFIIDIHKSGLDELETIEQARKLFYSKHREWIQTIILMNDNKIFKILKRK